MDSCVAAFVLMMTQTTQAQEPRDFREYLSISPIRADVVVVAEKLKVRLDPKTDLVVNKETNTLFIRASFKDTLIAINFISRLDARLGAPTYTYVTHLKNAEAGKITITIKMVLYLLAILGDDRDIHVIADERGKLIVVVASEANAEEVIEMIHRFDSRR